MHLKSNREAICIARMEMLMMLRDPAGGLALVNQAAVVGDSGVAYFLVMLWYRWNPTDPEVLVLLHKISSDPSQIYGRWENHSLPPLRYSVRRDLDVIAYWLWLSDHDVDPPGLLVEDTHVCTWAECRRWWDASCFIQYCSAGCRIRHEYDL